MPKVDLALAFTPTEETAAELGKLMPPSCIHDSLDLGVVERAMELQKELAHKERSLCLIADDCGFDQSIWRSKTIRSLFMNARHHRVALQLSVQWLYSIDPSLRSNVDYVVACAEPIHSNKKKLFASFFGVFESYACFDRVLTQCTKDYSCIVLDQTQSSPTIENSVFWFKANLAEEAAPFRLCKPIFYRLAERPRPTPKRDVLVVDEKPVDKRALEVVH